MENQSRTLPCFPSVLLMLDAEESEIVTQDKQIQKAYAEAIQDALETIRMNEEEQRRNPPPAPGNLSRELRVQRKGKSGGNIMSTPGNNTIDISTEDFLHMKAELEKLNDDLVRRSRGTGEDDSKFLAVDEFDPHALDTMDKVIKGIVKTAQDHFRKKEYTEALRVLTELTNAYPPERLNPYIFQNISACYYQLEQWDLVLRTTRRALELNTELDVGHRRLFRTMMITECITEAKEFLEPHKRKSYWSGEVAAMKAYVNYQSLYDSHLYSHAMRELEALLRIIPCATFETLKVQLLSLDRTIDGVLYAEERMKTYPQSSDLKYWHSELRFRLASSSEQLREVLQEYEGEAQNKSDIRFRYGVKVVAKSLEMVQTVEKMTSEGKWNDLIVLCSSILKSACLGDGLILCLLATRSRAYINTKQWYQGFDDASKAMHYAEDEKWKGELLLLLARCEEGLQRWQDAVLHAEKANQLLQTPAAAHALQNLRIALMQHMKKMRDAEEKRRRAQEEAERQWAEREARTKQQKENQHAYEEFNRKQRAKFGKAAPNSYDDEDDDDFEPRQQQSTQQNRKSKGAPPPPVKPRSAMEEHFKVLSLSITKDASEVKKTYRALAMKWHPDKWSGKSAAEIATAEKKFKEIQNAYESIMSSLK